MSYDARRSLKEATAFAGTASLSLLCDTLDHYVETGTGRDELTEAARAVAMELRRRHLPPERCIAALKISKCAAAMMDPNNAQYSPAAKRYAEAVHLLCDVYFGARQE